MATLQHVGRVRIIDEASPALDAIRSKAAALVSGVGQLTSATLGLSRAAGEAHTQFDFLSRVRFFAEAYLIFGAIQTIVIGLRNMAANAFEAVGAFQQMNVQFTYLIANEMARGEKVTRYRTVAVELTEKEEKALAKAHKAYQEATEAIAYYTLRLEELNGSKRAQASTILRAQQSLEKYREKAAEAAATIAALEAKTTQHVRVAFTQYVNQKAVNEVLGEARERARELIKELELYAIKSPFTFRETVQVMRMAVAYGFTVEEAKRLTKAILDLGAGLGLSQAELSRLTYNLVQVRSASKMTAMDVRQLAWAGLNAASMFEFFGQKLNMTMKDHTDFNRALASGRLTWEKFVELFEQYSRERFGGAAEALSRTLIGLKSNFEEIFLYTLPKILGPAIEAVTALLLKLFDIFLTIHQSGVLERIGESFGRLVAEKLQPLQRVLDDLARGRLPDFLIAVRNAYAVLNATVQQVIPNWDLFRAISIGLAVVIGRQLLVGLFQLVRALGPLGIGLAVIGTAAELLAPYLGRVGEELRRILAVAAQSGPLEALRTLLRDLGAPPEVIATVERLWRTLEALGERVRILLEIARDLGPLRALRVGLAELGVPPEVRDQIEGMIRQLGEELPTLPGRVSEAARTIAQTVTDMARSIWDGMQAWLLPVVDAARTVFDAIGSTVAGTVQAVQDILRRHEEDIRWVLDVQMGFVQTMKALFEAALPFIRDQWAAAWRAIGIIVSAAVQLIGRFVEMIVEIIMSLVTVFRGVVTGDFRLILEGLQNIVGAVMKFIVGAVADVSLILVTAAANLVRVFLDTLAFLIPGMGDIRDQVVAVLDGMVTALFWIWQTFLRDLNTTFTVASIQVQGILDGLVRFVMDLFGRRIPEAIQAAAGAIWNAAVGIGNGIVSGIRSGIEGMWQGLVDWVNARVNELINSIRNALRIFSPSGVMEEVGRQMAVGLQVGFGHGMRGALREAAVGGAGITVNIRFGDVSVRSDADIQRLAQRVSREIGSTIRNRRLQ